VVNVSGINITATSGAELKPERVAGTGSLSEITPEEEEKADEEKDKIILNFSGGRGDSQAAVTSEILGTFISGPSTTSIRRR